MQTHSSVLMLHVDVPWAGKLAHETAQQFHLSYLCETAESPKKHQWDLEEYILSHNIMGTPPVDLFLF